MLGLDVSPADVAAYAPDAPAVTADQVLEARDWAEPLLERAGIVLVPDSRQERAARRAVMNYALHLRTRQVVNASGLNTAEVVKMKDGAEEITFAERDQATLTSSSTEWLAQAWTALYNAGVPRPTRVVGASR